MYIGVAWIYTFWYDLNALCHQLVIWLVLTNVVEHVLQISAIFWRSKRSTTLRLLRVFLWTPWPCDPPGPPGLCLYGSRPPASVETLVS
jgi:hypothetical protein